MVTAILGATAAVSISSGKKDVAEEEENEKLEETTAKIEAIDENQELSKSVDDLTEEYKKLSDEGGDISKILD
jgi:hypothetical protein